MKDSTLAGKQFGSNSLYLDQRPRTNFQYYVRPVLSPFARDFVTSVMTANTISNIGGISAYLGSPAHHDWEQDFGFLVSKLSRPSIDITTETVSQYNKQRVIHTNHRYGEGSFTFYDTVDNQILSMFLSYYGMYFNENRNPSSDSAWDGNVVHAINEDNEWGAWSLQTSENNATFFERFEVYILYAGYYTRVDYIRPKITHFGQSDLSFSDSSGVATIDIRFKIEGAVLHSKNNPIANNSGLSTELKLDEAEFYEPPKDTSSVVDLSEATKNTINDIKTTTTRGEEFDSLSVSGLSVAGNVSEPPSKVTSVSGLEGTYANSGDFSKMFDTLTTARVDAMSSHNLGDLASNVGFDFFNTGQLSNQFFRFSNPTLRSQSVLGKFL